MVGGELLIIILNISITTTLLVDSRVAQRERAGLITQRSMDRNHPLLSIPFFFEFFFFFFLFTYSLTFSFSFASTSSGHYKVIRHD